MSVRCMTMPKPPQPGQRPRRIACQASSCVSTNVATYSQAVHVTLYVLRFIVCLPHHHRCMARATRHQATKCGLGRVSLPSVVSSCDEYDTLPGPPTTGGRARCQPTTSGRAFCLVNTFPNGTKNANARPPPGGFLVGWHDNCCDSHPIFG